ncbi:MAG: 16S rRNA processing protein RimM [Oscillospiraceae bacterium]|nr:16S rRNA processing protein RimM [Oscillospiraceae bacterium]
MKEFLETGKIVNIHGLRGEIKIMPWSDDAQFLCEFDVLYCGRDKKAFEVENARVHKNTVLAKFRGIDTPEAANALRNSIVYIDRDDVELEDGTYFIADLIGLTVKDADTDAEYGTVKDVFQTGANDVYEVEKDGKSRYVPAIPDVIISTDIENKVLLIRPLEGLFDEN